MGWEYKCLKMATDVGLLSGTDFDSDRMTELLNVEGAVGWELVSVFSIEKQKGGSKYVMAVLKRSTGQSGPGQSHSGWNIR